MHKIGDHVSFNCGILGKFLGRGFSVFTFKNGDINMSTSYNFGVFYKLYFFFRQC